MVLSLTGIAFVLGLVGFAYLPHEVPLSWADAVYNALRLFVLNGTVTAAPIEERFFRLGDSGGGNEE